MENELIISVRSYAYKINKRDNWICQYCGLDGKQSFANWLALSVDHLLPKGHRHRNDADFIVTSCQFCNTADNRYFDNAMKRGLTFDGLTMEELINQRKPFVRKTRDNYLNFWKSRVSTAY